MPVSARKSTSVGLLLLSLLVGALVLSTRALAATEAAPTPGREYASEVTGTSAVLGAEIDPGGGETTYHFQYGTSMAYGQSTVESGSIGSDESEHPATALIQGLQPATEYHYRVVATNSMSAPGGTPGSDQTFTTQSVGGELTLPGGRDWEMVSPPSKQGALIVPLGSHLFEALNVQASSNGNAVAFMTNSPPEVEPKGFAGGVSILATRGSSEWSSQTLAPPHEEGTGPSIGNGGEYRFFSEDLSLGMVQVFGNFDKELSPEATEQTPYMRTVYEQGNVNAHCLTSCYQPLVTAANTAPGAQFGETTNGACVKILCGPQFKGATPDLSHVVINSTTALTSPSGGDLYEWSAGHVQPVSLLPQDEGGGPAIGEVGDERGEIWQHAISNDGSRVIWWMRFEGQEHIYLRDLAKNETIRLDLPQGVPGESSEVEFMTASNDLSRIFFLDAGRLTKDSKAAFRDPDLYEYDLNAPLGSRLSDLTAALNSEKEYGGVQRVLGASEDGSYLYYAIREMLFEYHEGKTTFIASPGAPTDWASPLQFLTARVSTNGRWLAFQSPENLTGYDTADVISGVSDEEVYLYNGETNKLVCASCDPTGARPAGEPINESNYVDMDLLWQAGTWVSAVIPPWSRLEAGAARYQSRFLSDSGRLFFDSDEGLVPQDVNGTVDVYEYDPPGEGNCTTSSSTFSARSDGCVGSISSGTSPQESTFMDASETGDDVFFLTTAKLLTQDFDSAYDIYDAHACSDETPCYPATPVSPPACDTSDSCKAAQTPQPPIFGSPSSETFSGAGNVTATPKASVKPKAKTLRRAQKLSRALNACKKKPKSKRKGCEAQARMRYSSTHKAKKTNRRAK